MDFPLDIHGNALQAAQAGRCAGEQGQFGRCMTVCSENPEELDLAKLVEYARESGLDAVTFRQCVEDGKYKEDIRQAVREAAVKAVRGTPTFVIGRSTASGVEGT